MEAPPTKSIPHKKGHPSFVSTILFLLFDLVWISLLAWLLLEAWFIYKAVTNHNENLIKIFIDVAKTTITRIHFFIDFMPFLSVMLGIFIIDGLVLRDIRKFQGARESTFVFHRIKPLIKASFLIFYFAYLTNPYKVAPEIFLLPMTLLTGLFASLSVKSFKKYL